METSRWEIISLHLRQEACNKHVQDIQINNEPNGKFTKKDASGNSLTERR